MARKHTAKNADDIVKWAEDECKKSVNTEDIPAPYKHLAAWQLRGLGYTREQTAQVFGVHPNTIAAWEKNVDPEMAKLPAVRLAIDAMKTKIPKAIAAYDRALDSADERVAKDAAKDILISFNVISDKKEIAHSFDGRTKSDDDLIAEAERIITGAKREVRTDTERTKTQEA